MIKSFLFACIIPVCMVAKVHYARVEPYASVVMKAAVSGLVVEVDLEAEGSMVEKGRIVHIDDRLEKQNLKDSRKRVQLLKQMLVLNEQIAASLEETVKRQEGYYRRISKLPTASKTQKDSAYSTYASANTQYLGTKEKMISLQKQILDMEYRVAQLQDTIMKKSIFLSHRYLYRLMVRVGDFVAPGTPLAKVEDMSRAKLVLFLEPEEFKNIKARVVYIDGKKTSYHVDKVWRVADEKFISSYRAEIYLPAPKEKFSQLLKVELK